MSTSLKRGDYVFENNFMTLFIPSANLFEPPLHDFPVGIGLRGVSKTYGGKKKALKNLTLNIYKGQITSLLGHNGAAKTTTL